MNNHMKHTIAAGLVAGYLATCLQLTDGYGEALSDARTYWGSTCDDLANKYKRQADTLSENVTTCIDSFDGVTYVNNEGISPEDTTPEVKKRLRKLRRYQREARSLKQLSVCGWCISPWLALPVYLIVSARDHVPLRDRLVGWGVATSIAAFLRHTAEIY